MFLFLFLQICCIFVLPGSAYGNKRVYGPGALIKPSKGEVWPKPQLQNYLDDSYFSFVPQYFQFTKIGSSCVTLDEALERYTYILTFQNRLIGEIYYPVSNCSSYSDSNYLGPLLQLDVQLAGPCNDSEYPTIDMKEEYILNITSDVQLLSSNTLWGILRGLETFSQLVYLTDDHSCHRINTTSIYDYPRFSHRSLLVDTARHYISKETILLMIDAMSYNKLNVFHWHITDDQSFPYVSKTFPELSEKGAYHPTVYVYDQDFVKYVQDYSRKRGIRVLVEFDTPGHMLSWGSGAPNLLTKCYNIPLLDYGPIDPTKNSTYEFMYKFLAEIKEVFNDDHIHLGGDEVEFLCWLSNPDIVKFMYDKGVEDFDALQSYYFEKLIDFVVHDLGLTPIVWEEAYNHNVRLSSNAVVNVWINDAPDAVTAKATLDGFRVIVSSYWYMDQLETGGDWLKFYNEDPQNFNGSEEQKSRVIGAEAAMWGEVVNDYNLESRVFPRASAAAERFWSSMETAGPLFLEYLDERLFFDVGPRLEEQTCRLNRRGIKAQPPTGPSVCF